MKKLTVLKAAVLGSITTLPAQASEQEMVPPPSEAVQSGTIESDGTVMVQPFALPPSDYLSEAAKAALPRKAIDAEAPLKAALAAGKASQMRALIPQYMKPRIDELKSLYGVKTEVGSIAGIDSVTFEPESGIPEANRDKILLNLPGGGFVMGHAGGTGSLESIPLAKLAGIKIVSITYRQAPEYSFPAASEDVAVVYRELLKTYRPENIGIFGCSAGGMLAAQSMAWFLQENLPLPKAIGIFCASADARWAGDSRHFGRPFAGLPPENSERRYIARSDMISPLASPILSSEILARFPPTLFLTGTRAFEMSAATNSHKELVKAGVDARLHIWDGLGHAFFYDPKLPESREAFDVMADFFGDRLGLVR
ncbi:alpha/beta hydrolase fold domain-containing protein [Parasphingorhabdus sp.]|uniref:alpha/beta hydrolase fold domain-containing protein n=1 Tax=Parasphingorhabdus sp. TaxID=2709688 RepID=UPI003A8E2BF1